MKKRSLILALASLLATSTAGLATEVDASKYDTGLIPSPHIEVPDGDIAAAVVLISDADGWGAAEEEEARTLSAGGTVVIGIDFPSYMAALRKDDGDCIYLVSDIESLSQQVQRAAGNAAYRLPIVAGAGEGGALALAIAAQSPAATIGETLAVDPLAGIPLTKQLCTPATKQTVGERMIYGLTDGPLPDPVTISFTPKAAQDGRDHAKALQEAHPDIDIRSTEGDADTALITLLQERIAAMASDDRPLGLPIDVLEAKPALDTMAIIYSGDGGWRDLDRQVGSFLQAQGIPVVGIDSLRYFWTERQPQETADDLSRIIALYRKEWNVKHVMLIGYSFGADILPATYNRLSAADRAVVSQISLLALSHQVDYEISVMGWLGSSTSDGSGDPINDLKSIDPKLVQCIYGTDEDDDACPTLKDSGAEVVGIDGGHHFDENYEALTKMIVDGFRKRISEQP